MLCPATAVDRGSDMCDDRVVPAVGRRVSLSWDGVWYTGTVDDHRILLSRDHHSVHHVAKEFHVAYDDGTRHWQQRSSDRMASWQIWEGCGGPRGASVVCLHG